MPALRDQTGWEIVLHAPAKRIVSLVPSQSELLWDLGLGDALVGVTKFCVHPAELRSRKTVVGGTKNIRLKDVLALQPDLVVANKEENTRKDVEALRARVPVYVSDVDNPQTAMGMMRDLGVLTGHLQAAEEIASKTKICLDKLPINAPSEAPLRVLYLIWKDPYMAAGPDTFISAMLNKLGWSNALSDIGERGLRYPALTMSEIAQLAPDAVLLSSEPFPFKASHAEALAKELAAMSAKNKISIHCVDGEAFSWYGSRIPKSAKYYAEVSSVLRNR